MSAAFSISLPSLGLGATLFLASTQQYVAHNREACGSRIRRLALMRVSDAHNSGTQWPLTTKREMRVLLRKGWANADGKVIRPVEGAENVWVIERSYIWAGYFDVGGKSVVIRLANGGLFVHAPLALSLELKLQLNKIGDVAVVVSPNSEHCDFVAQWKMHFPRARYLAAPGLMKKRNDLPFDGELSRVDVADEGYRGEIEQIFIGSAPFFNEVVFYHTSSGSLLVTDLFWNYPSGQNTPMETASWAWAMNHIYKPVYNRILVRDREYFCRSLRKILEKPLRRIIPCHGLIVSQDAGDILRGFFEPHFEV